MASNDAADVKPGAFHSVGSLVRTLTPPVKIQKTAFGADGCYPIIDQSQNEIAGWTDDEAALIRPRKPLVIFGDHTCAVKLVATPFAQGADGIKILETVEQVDPQFLYLMLRSRPLQTSGYQRHFSKLKEMEIPVPPLEVQLEVINDTERHLSEIARLEQCIAAEKEAVQAILGAIWGEESEHSPGQ